MTHRLAFLICLAATSFATAARVHGAAIEHSPVGCVVADKFPRFEARIIPADSVARARVFFRGEGGSGWYSVAMTRAGDSFTAFLPKPKKSLPRFSYYVEVADTALATSRTAEHTAKVAADAATCTPDMMTAPSTATAAAAVLVEGPSGAAAVPAGFSGTSVVAAAPAAVAGVAGSAAGVTAASGGGIGAGTVVLAGAGVAAVGAGAVVATSVASDSDETSNGIIEVRGVVYGTQVINPADPAGPALRQPPIAGAVVSTSLDSVTTTTDGNGRFHLVTQTRYTVRCQRFTLTITAAGWPTWTATGAFGNAGPGSVGEVFYTLIPQLPDQLNSCF